MLACLTPAEFEEIRAARVTVPLDDGWQQAGTIAAAVHNEMAKLFAFKDGKSRVDKSSWMSPGDYIPKIRGRQKNRLRVNQSSIDLTQAIIESQFISY